MFARLLRRRRKADSPDLAAILRESDPLDLDGFISLGYQRILGRAPDAGGLEHFRNQLNDGGMTREAFLQELVRSPEYRRTHGKPAPSALEALHDSRMAMVRQLPAADVIVDLGGACHGRPEGAMVVMGYPHPFRSLTIVEPPRDDRHDIYRDVCADALETVQTRLGEVRYLFRSMGDLAGIPTGSVDLVFSGESIEHVTRAEAERVCAEAKRVLKPGGAFCFDTPNRRLTRIQVGDKAFINPDHKYEYAHAELVEMLTRHGFRIEAAKGLNRMPRTARTGRFREEEMIENPGMSDALEECYLLYYHCRA